MQHLNAGDTAWVLASAALFALAFAGFASLLGAWTLVARRRHALRMVSEERAVGEAGFLRRLA